MLKKILIFILLLLAVAVLGFLLGPKPQYEKVNNTPSTKAYNIAELDQILESREAPVQYLKPDNQSQIIWADSSQSKTPYSIVYIHGFSASQGEGFPMHKNIAQKMGANMYLPRLSGHGIDTPEAMKDLTPSKLVEDSKDAIAIGKTLGEKVIVMGCSTGGTLAIYLAANDPDIEAIILLSPNIEIANSSAAMVTGPWGKQLAYQLIGETRVIPEEYVYKPYWSHHYSTNGLIALQALLDQTMTEEIFEDVRCPVYCGYYYKNEDEQDPVVSVSAMLEFKEEISTSEDDYEFEAFPNANDHVICSSYKTENWKTVEDEVWDFIEREVIAD